MGGRGDTGSLGGAIAKLDWPLINDNLMQSIAYCQGYFEPVNGSWIQAICGVFGEFDSEYTIINGSWEYTFLNIIYQKSERAIIDGEPEIINGDIWQSIWYYIEGQLLFEELGLPGIDYAINGNWMNNYYQLACSTNGGIPKIDPDAGLGTPGAPK